MRANGTNNTYSRSLYFILFVLLFLLSKFSFAQPDYDFRNPTLITGAATDKQVGAKYRFSTVKAGTDAIVTITNMTGGVKLTTLDGNSGYNEAFQPSIDIPAFSSGYVEFTIDFVKAATSAPQVQVEIPVTPIDVDGIPLAVNEFDQIQLINGYTDYNLLGGELSINLPLGWVTGTNIAGIDYPGVDTSAKQVMFTVVNANVSSFIIRVGGTNISSTLRNRLRSVYFKKFAYPNSILLAKSPLSGFTGVKKDKKVELSWNLESNNSIKSVMVEKATTANNFSSIGEVWTNTEANVNHYAFNDNNAANGVVYYRLKMVSANGEAQYSNVLVFRLGDAKQQQFKMYPSVISDNATVTLSASKPENTSLQVVDLGGRTVYRRNISLQQGENNIALNGLGGLHNGTYVAWVKTGDAIYSQKIMIQ